jgi:hypothetical protein
VVRIHRNGTVTMPEHLSKDQGIALNAGDRVEVMTPGGGGYGDPFARDPGLVARDVRLGYYSRAEVRDLFGVALRPDGAVDVEATRGLRNAPVIPDGAMRAKGEQRSDPGPREAGSDSLPEVPDSRGPALQAGPRLPG